MSDCLSEGSWVRVPYTPLSPLVFLLRLFAFLTVLSWLLIALGIHIPLLWQMAYLCSSVLTGFLLYLLTLHLWRLLMQ